MTAAAPFLSVIVPAHQGAAFLPETLAALAASDLPRDRWELIVVDDDYRRERIRIAFNPFTERFEVTNAALEKNAEWIPDISTSCEPTVIVSLFEER